MVATMARSVGRGEHCRQQALECAAAAAATLRYEIKEAYLNLEQAWRHVGPEIDDHQYSSAPLGAGARTPKMEMEVAGRQTMLRLDIC
jgi:hypothetical protein